jgi:hypothetical protein
LLIALIVTVVTVGIGFMALPAHATGGDPHKYTICHRTASHGNPYVVITVDVASIDGQGKGDHFLEHQGPVFSPDLPKHTEWGDIIPPVPGVHDGLNWTAEGQAIYDHGCQPLTPPVPTYSPAVPSWYDACEPAKGNTPDTYTVPSDANFTYTVEGVTTAAGTYSATNHVYVIEAVANAGVNVTPGAATEWKIFFDKKTLCPQPPLPPTPPAPPVQVTGKVKIVDQCGADNELGKAFKREGVLYTRNGHHMKAGLFVSVDDGDVIRAKAKKGYVYVGKAKWVVNTTNKPCPTQPPGTGERTVPFGSSQLALR